MEPDQFRAGQLPARAHRYVTAAKRWSAPTAPIDLLLGRQKRWSSRAVEIRLHRRRSGRTGRTRSPCRRAFRNDVARFWPPRGHEIQRQLVQLPKSNPACARSRKRRGARRARSCQRRAVHQSLRAGSIRACRESPANSRIASIPRQHFLAIGSPNRSAIMPPAPTTCCLLAAWPCARRMIHRRLREKHQRARSDARGLERLRRRNNSQKPKGRARTSRRQYANEIRDPRAPGCCAHRPDHPPLEGRMESCAWI